MTSKHPYSAPDSTGLYSLSRFPPRFSLQSALLATIIPLPNHPRIAYAIWSPTSTATLPDSLTYIEQARKRIVQHNEDLPIPDSLLSSLHFSAGSISLYVFAVGSVDKPSAAQAALAQLSFVGLIRTGTSSFTPSELYPCSDVCASQSTPCHACLDGSGPSQRPTSARLLPRHPLRRPFVQFLDGVRKRLIEIITDAACNGHTTLAGMHPARLGTGFVFGAMTSPSEWRSGWNSYSNDHPLTYCELSIHLSQLSPSSSRLIIQPWLRVSHYFPLVPTLPIPPGTPVALLPHGVPAYFLSMYTGSTGTLTARFADAFLGLGAGYWRRQWSSRDSPSNNDPIYIIVWVAIPSKSDEEKGMVLVWPASLCVGFIAGSSCKHAQSHLENIPALPAHLQASPPLPETYVPLALSSSVDPPPEQDLGLSLSLRPSPAPTFSHPPSPSHRSKFLVSQPLPHPGLRRSPTPHALHAFRSLTLQYAPHDVEMVSGEVSGFVGTVARERERERERIRKERQSSSSMTVTINQETPTAPALSSPGVAEVSDIIRTAPASPEASVAIPSSEVQTKRRSGSLFSDDASNPDTPMQEESIELPHEPPEMYSAFVKEEPTPISLPKAPPSTEITNLDGFSAFDTGWPGSTDYGMEFQLNLDDALGTTDDLGMDDNFGVFTEDDFDFFNGPTLAAADTTITPVPSFAEDRLPTSVFSPSVSGGPPLNILTRTPVEDGLPTGLGPPSAHSQSSPWAAFHPNSDSLTPQTELVDADIDVPLKALSDRRPSTVPIVDHILPLPGLNPRYQSAFEAIPFGLTHRLSDGKYLLGKFALPSPPPEDEVEPFVPSHAILKSPTWKSSYSVATDPRIRMTRKLVGSKRKLATQGGRAPNLSPGRFQDRNEWIQNELPLADDTSESENEECWTVDDRVSPDPKPATPPPSYLPLGPTLLQTHFHYPFLQSFSAIASTQGPLMHNSTTTPAAISAPTPISPAAILGSSSEKTKSLEAAGQILLREAVENPVWAEAWRASTGARSSKLRVRDIWPVDIKRVAALLDTVPLASSSVSLETIIGVDSMGAANMLQMMDPPLLTVAKTGEVINVLPSALRFWEKLGLLPRNGTKDVVAFMVYDQTHNQNEQQVVELFERFSTIYSAKHYGKHQAGVIEDYSENGTVRIRFESFRKGLSTLISRLSSETPNIVIYILTPDYTLQLASPVLRQVLSAIKRINKTRHPSAPILFQFIPERLLAASSSPESPSLETFIDSVYDRVLRPVVCRISNRYASVPVDARAYQQTPAFTLAKPLHTEVKFTNQESVDILDVVDRFSVLHIGYQVTHQHKWLLATSTDQHGEAHDLKAWLIPEDDDIDSFIVNSVWSFTVAMARRANVEWHVVVAKRGAMSAHEMDVWRSHLESALQAPDALAMQVSLLCVEQNNPWYFLAQQGEGDAWIPGSARGSKGQGSIALDITTTSLAFHSGAPFPISLRTQPDAATDLLLPVDAKDRPSIDELGMLPIATSTLAHVPSQADYTAIAMLHLHFLYLTRSSHSTSTMTNDIIRQEVVKSYYDLGVLAQARWGKFGFHNLPLHFAALEVMITTLDEPDRSV
ncbi:mediator complex subunit 13 C-terminal-domain-containing protein, partial [Cristinia sonorae]